MVPRKVGTAWEVLAPAKLNLYLEVLGKRTDGFHELETLMVPVRLYDHIRWIPSQLGRDSSRCGLIVETPNPAYLSALSDQNLILKAANLLAAEARIEPHGLFHLTKRIPVEAGMGGGSSDAAASLLLANEAWQLGFSRPRLGELAAELGSDVPFFLNSGPAICRGRGELIEACAGLPRLDFVVVKPDFGLSTQAVFHELHEMEPISDARRQESAAQLSGLLNELLAGAIGRACHRMTNRLEEGALRLASGIECIKLALARAGCWGQFMTGSGSAVIGIVRSAKMARQIARTLSAQNYGTVLAAASGW
jgi:4-diphosphocytidyl-2-C-methyl-D-erythritol kinase